MGRIERLHDFEKRSGGPVFLRIDVVLEADSTLLPQLLDGLANAKNGHDGTLDEWFVLPPERAWKTVRLGVLPIWRVHGLVPVVGY
jgi:hypothetical protein